MEIIWIILLVIGFIAGGLGFAWLANKLAVFMTEYLDLRGVYGRSRRYALLHAWDETFPRWTSERD